MKLGTWYELFPGGVEQRGSRLRYWGRSVDRGFELKASVRWTGRIVAVAAHPQTWQEMIAPTQWSKALDDFINSLLLPSDTIGALSPSDPSFQANYPRLWAFLTVQTVRGRDGEAVARKTSTISVYMGAAGPQAFLNDRACQRCLVATSDAFQGIWGALEDALGAEVVPWRHLDAWQPEKKSTSRKRGG